MLSEPKPNILQYYTIQHFVEAVGEEKINILADGLDGSSLTHYTSYHRMHSSTHILSFNHVINKRIHHSLMQLRDRWNSNPLSQIKRNTLLGWMHQSINWNRITLFNPKYHTFSLLCSPFYAWHVGARKICVVGVVCGGWWLAAGDDRCLSGIRAFNLYVNSEHMHVCAVRLCDTK